MAEAEYERSGSEYEEQNEDFENLQDDAFNAMLEMRQDPNNGTRDVVIQQLIELNPREFIRFMLKIRTSALFGGLFVVLKVLHLFYQELFDLREIDSFEQTYSTCTLAYKCWFFSRIFVYFWQTGLSLRKMFTLLHARQATTDNECRIRLRGILDDSKFNLAKFLYFWVAISFVSGTFFLPSSNLQALLKSVAWWNVAVLIVQLCFVAYWSSDLLDEFHTGYVEVPEAPIDVTKHSKKFLYEEISHSLLEHKCVICLADYSSKHALRVLNCGHAFHKLCLDAWVIRGKKSCPMCNQQIETATNLHSSSTTCTDSLPPPDKKND